MQGELAALCAAGDKSERIAELKQILGSVKIVEPPESSSKSVFFGATVTLRDPYDKTETHTIVGVDELDYEPNAVTGFHCWAKRFSHRNWAIASLWKTAAP